MIAIYVRVSTEEQLKGYSVEGQIEDCMELASSRDVLKYVDDGYTGEILNRPKLAKLLADVEKGIVTKVVCYDPDRLSRKLLNQLIITEKLQKNQVELEFVKSDFKNDPEGQLYFQVRGAFSEFDKAKIKHNTMTGRYRKAKQGYVVKNSGLFGYDYDLINKTYTINEQEANIVQMIFEYFTNPNNNFKGINSIAKYLTEMGIPTAKGNSKWHRQVVRQILMNASYTGTYYQNRYDTEGNYVKKQAGEVYRTGRMRPKEEWVVTAIPRIIEQKQFDYARALLQKARRQYASFSRHNYLLSSCVRCGRCGATMNGRKRKSHGNDFYVYECRKNYAGSKKSGCGRMMSENKLNHHVWLAVIELLNNQEEIKALREIPQKSYSNEEIKFLEDKLKKAQKGKQRLLTLVSISDDEEIDLKEVMKKIKAIQQTELKIKERMKELKKEASNKPFDQSEQLLFRAITCFLNRKEPALSVEDKQKILKLLIKEVEVIDAKTVHIYTF